MKNDHRKSDRPVVAAKPSNKAGKAAAERVERRGLAEGKTPRQNTDRAQDRANVQRALWRIRQAAVKDKKQKFTSLMHHIYNESMLREAYYGLKRDAAPGVDGETWRQYGQDLERNLQELSGRLRRGAYRARPVRRVYIAKADGRQRPLGVTALEDKIVQRATVEVMNAIYEIDFLGFSYGYRPGKNPHNALDALYVGLLTKKVNWVLDGDLSSFFDGLDHEWLVKFIEHRIGDQRVVRVCNVSLKQTTKSAWCTNAVISGRASQTEEPCLHCFARAAGCVYYVVHAPPKEVGKDRLLIGPHGGPATLVHASVSDYPPNRALYSKESRNPLIR